MKSIKRFLSDDKGLETVEYAIMAGLIVVGLILVIATLGDTIRAKFQTLNDHI